MCQQANFFFGKTQPVLVCKFSPYAPAEDKASIDQQPQDGIRTRASANCTVDGIPFIALRALRQRLLSLDIYMTRLRTAGRRGSNSIYEKLRGLAGKGRVGVYSPMFVPCLLCASTCLRRPRNVLHCIFTLRI